MDIPISNNLKPAMDLGFDNSTSQSIPNYNSQEFSNNQNTNVSSNQTRQATKGVSLIKGQKISLTNMCPNLEIIEVGLGWDVTCESCDLDSEAFLLSDNDRVLDSDWFVFYNQPTSPDRSVVHSGDNRTGDGYGDDETITVYLKQVNPQVKKIVFVVTINEAFQKNQNFGNVKNAYIRVSDKTTNKELVRYNLTEYYKEVTSMVIGELYFKGNEWRFNPVGNGTANDLLGLCKFYGVEIID